MEGVTSKSGLSLSMLMDESRSRPSAVLSLARSSTLQLLRLLSICCARHADEMPPSAVTTFCNLLHTLTVSGHRDDTAGKSLGTVSFHPAGMYVLS